MVIWFWVLKRKWSRKVVRVARVLAARGSVLMKLVVRGKVRLRSLVDWVLLKWIRRICVPMFLMMANDGMEKREP